MTLRRLAAFVLLCALAGPMPPARAQMESREAISLQNQILELRRDLQRLQEQGGGAPAYAPPSYAPSAGAPTSGLDAQLLDRVQSLEDQVRQLRGQLDEQTNALKTAQERLGKQIDDLNFRLGNTQATAATPPTSSPTAPTTAPSSTATPPAPPAAPTHRPPHIALQEGNAALARRDYPAAEAAAREVIAGGRSARTGDADFLLAQALLGQRNYQGAAIAYDDAYNFSRTGPRAPDALLGLANALTGLNQRPAACTTLAKLRHEFSSLRGPVRDTAAQLWTRNGCT